jgi:hypothetical protein
VWDSFPSGSRSRSAVSIRIVSCELFGIYRSMHTDYGLKLSFWDTQAFSAEQSAQVDAKNTFVERNNVVTPQPKWGAVVAAQKLVKAFIRVIDDESLVRA